VRIKEMSRISNLRKDYLASNIRCQVNTLNSIINNMESHDYLHDEYADESLQRVIINLVKLRRNVKNF
jgi:hypothetical protein